MNNSIKESGYRHNNAAVLLADQSGSNISNLSTQSDISKIDLPIKNIDQKNLLAAANDNTLTATESKSLNGYVVQHCHSLRNLLALTKPQPYLSLSRLSLSPDNLLVTAEQRLLSIDELDEMHRYIQQQTDITVNGKRFELETLPEDTPLFYQFYCLDQKARIDDKSLGIFRNNCRVDSRAAIILTNKALMNEQVAAQTGELEKEFENVHVVDVSLLLKHRIHGIEITQRRDRNGRLILTVDASECTMKDRFSAGDSKVREYSTNSNILDIFQFVAMYHCDKVGELAKIQTYSRGCIKIDFDTELTAPIGALQCPNGFRAYVADMINWKRGTRNNELTHSLGVENGILAVTRPEHLIMAESVIPSTDVFGNYIDAVRKSFNLPHSVPAYDVQRVTPTRDGTDLLKLMCNKVEKGEVARMIARKIHYGHQLRISFDTSTSWMQKIAFPLSSTKADQSRVWGVCSWSEAHQHHK